MSPSPIVSVIVPVYNVERYLSRCLDSIVSQTMPGFEVICVNDGSTDNSGDVLESYARQDARVSVVTQENAGLSAARNCGMRHAKGKYLYFCDPDDYISPVTFSQGVRHMELHDLDLLFFGGVPFQEEGSGDALDHSLPTAFRKFENYYRRSHLYEGAFPGLTLLELMLENDEYRASACMQMTRRDFVTDVGVTFDEGAGWEDNYWTFAMTVSAAHAGCIPDRLYYRSVRENSITSVADPVAMIHGYSRCLMSVAEFASRADGACRVICVALPLLQQYRNNLVRLWKNLSPLETKRLLSTGSAETQFVYRLSIEPSRETRV